MGESEFLTFALPKGRLGKDTQKLLYESGVLKTIFDADSRKLLYEFDNLKIMLVRAQDVPVYVERGIADLGIVGKDVLVEKDSNLVELADTGLGYCRIVVAGKPDSKLLSSGEYTVATKYPKIARQFFQSRGMSVKIIKLYGSVELASITNMADFIVDLVSTGRTLKENGLVVVEEIAESTARVIANFSSFYIKFDLIKSFISNLGFAWT